MIRETVVYETMGKIFDTLEDAIEFRENLIVKFIEKRPGFEEFPRRNLIEFIGSILSNRKELINLLQYDIDKLEEIE